MAKYELLQAAFIGNAYLEEGAIVDDSAFPEGFKYDKARDTHLAPVKGGKATTDTPSGARVGGAGRTTDEGEPTNEGGGDLT